MTVHLKILHAELDVAPIQNSARFVTESPQERLDYSEAPLLSGTVVSHEVRGAASKGMYTYIKDLAVYELGPALISLITFPTVKRFRNKK